MKVLLISPPSRIMNHYRPPLALMYLSGYLKKHGVAAEIIDVTLKNQIRNKAFYENKDRYLADVEDKIVRRVESSDCDVAGITCYTPELDEVKRMAAKIKSFKPGARVIAGGIHPTLYPDDFLGPVSPFDFVVVGEGEITLLELIKKMDSRASDYRGVRGIGFFDKTNSKNVLTEKRPLAKNLDDISFPDCEDLDMDFYTTPSPYAIRGVFTKSFYISSSRGCPSACSFCVSKKLREYYNAQDFVRLRSPQALFEEVQSLRNNYGIDAFYFIDDLFTLRKKNVFEFCELMVKNKSPLIWGCSSKVNTVDYETLKIMRDAGCIQIDFGVEKGTDAALKALKKGVTIEQVKRTFGHCLNLGIRTFANMLVNTPQETEEDLEDMARLIRKISPNIVSFNIFSPYPGCEIYDALAKNIKREDYPLLMNTALLLKEMPDKFRFAAHSIDLLDWTSKANKKYNKILPNLAVYFDRRYIRNMIHSKRKAEYLRQVPALIQEFISQKFYA
ncbi:MAG: radical SAM protein [Candidatus Omnitrophota bacterium]